MNNNLYVVGVLSNPVGYESRWRLYKDFVNHMADSGVTLITVEQAFGSRPFVVTQHNNPLHVQLRAGEESELWVKESLVNIGIKYLNQIVPSWKYVAWIDGDVRFVRNDWPQATVRELEHFKVVQPWSNCIDLGPDDETIGLAHSLGSCFHKYPLSYGPKGKYGTPFWHPGYAWAIRRETYEQVQGLIDWCILGAADNHMAWAFLGDIGRAISAGITNPNYLRKAKEFEALCNTYVQRELGYVKGTLLHGWHGKKRTRFYVERWKTLIDHNFDPDTDITTNADGLVIFTNKNIKLKQALRAYFRSRDEDSIDLE